MDQSLDSAIKQQTAQMASLRGAFLTNFARAALSMMVMPRYRHLSIADLEHMLVEPVMRDRVAIATVSESTAERVVGDVIGIAIWARVSASIEENILEQIKAGVFPIRMGPDDWDSGELVWILDVVAPSSDLAIAVLANFGSMITTSKIRLHPIVKQIVDAAAIRNNSYEGLAQRA
jgi:cytolysin-activating lysine-acyltransferase